MSFSPAPPPLPVPGKNRSATFARYSWLSFVISLGINASLSIVGKQFGFDVPPLVIGILVTVLALSGVVAGIVALFGVGQHGAKGIVAPAITGICLWGLSFALTIPAVLAVKKRAAAQKLVEHARAQDEQAKQEMQARTSAARPEATHAPSAERVEGASLGFAFDLPEGYVAFEASKKPKKYSHAFVRESPDGVNRVLLVEPMSLRLGNKRLRNEDIPAGSPLKLLSFNWRGVNIDAIRVPEKMGEVDYVTYNVQVPLKQNAVQIGFGGPASGETQMKEMVETLLATLEGEADR